MAVDVILGLQWGDEGKGKIVDRLAESYDVVCRYQGGPNAGHTLIIEGKKHVLHTIPSGVFRPHITNIVGSGVVIDPIVFMREIDGLDATGLDYRDRLLIARKAHLILPTHRLLDAAAERAKGADKIGSTLRGIGPTYMDKTGRNGLRIGDIESAKFDQKYAALKEKHLGLLKAYPEIDFDLQAEEKKFMESIERLRSLAFVDGAYLVNEYISQNKKVLAEGAQGAMLDIDFGTYPFVTSSNTVSAGVCTGLGVSPRQIGEVIGVSKAYTTRVGSGPFPSELFDETGEKLQKAGHEFGATTGRPRRCGWVDIPQLKYSCMINGVTRIALTKVDVLSGFDPIKMVTHYNINGTDTDQMPYDLMQSELKPVTESYAGWEEDISNISSYDALPESTKKYIESMEQLSGYKISDVSTGPERSALVVKS